MSKLVLRLVLSAALIGAVLSAFHPFALGQGPEHDKAHPDHSKQKPDPKKKKPAQPDSPPAPHDAMPDMPGMPLPSPSPSPQASPTTMGMPAGAAMEMGPLMIMTGDQVALRVGSSATNTMPLGQMGSGTSWQPASTPLFMLDKQAGDWLLMFHFNLVSGVNSQGGARGVTKVESANWFMPMAVHKLGKGTLQLRGMFSVEPFTFPRGGAPLLFQTGETFKGQPLIDRQHPHDFVMELSATYTAPLGERAQWFAYVGYPGEPALGPTAFMHRGSAAENPGAPLAHHLQDSTHISFGVFTSGFTYRWFKLEGSVFNGREPDENRYNFEAHPWNSRAARLSFAPNSNWSLQVSHGFLRNPEALEPGDTRRTTASISYNKVINHGNWATSIIWGRNHERHDREIFNLNGYTVESTVNFLDRNALYTRLELVDKNQLLRASDLARLNVAEAHPAFRIGALTFGGARDLWTGTKLTMAAGGDLTFYQIPTILDSVYGRDPVSYRLFLRLRPTQMSMHGH